MFSRHCLAYVYGHLLEKSLTEFKQRWNSHRIRQNRVAGCPPGIPDDLYFLPQSTGQLLILVMYTPLYIRHNYTGTRSYKHPLDLQTWSHCFLEWSCAAPSFYPLEFEVVASAILNQLHATRQSITTANARAIYLHICQIMSS